jgi:hypothetical protein
VAAFDGRHATVNLRQAGILFGFGKGFIQVGSIQLIIQACQCGGFHIFVHDILLTLLI